jgi:glycosyltransferase involved in cell wall biosynthesis
MLTFMGFDIPRDGYGYGTRKIAEELRRIDSGVNFVDMARNGLLIEPQERLWVLPGRAVVLCQPDWWSDVMADELIGYTMFEATQLPRGWAEKINSCCTRLLVPCEWNRLVFETSGVNVPIDLAPLGIDQEDYWYIDREAERIHHGGDDRPYTFLWSGTPDLRKGWDVAYRAFRLAFGDRRDVQLVMHFRAALPGDPRFGDRNVRTAIGRMDPYSWRAMLASTDVFVFPSRGEGWGLPPREAAATGLPTIATDYGGLHDEIELWGLPLNVAHLSPAEFGEWNAGEVGEWAEPDVDHLVELLRWCEANRNEAARRGAAASEWLINETPWRRTAQAVLRGVKNAEDEKAVVYAG